LQFAQKDAARYKKDGSTESSICKPNNPNAPAAFHIGDKSFHTGDIGQ
jgi:hypothetical protein